MSVATARRSSTLFSTAMFRPTVEGRANQRLDHAVRELRQDLGIARHESNSAVVAAAYDTLATQYRSEYFYKNLITSKIFLGRHRGANAVLLNEFRVGDSVADCVLVNGKGAVYEIKTEFDSPEKLQRQLSNYYKAFPFVNVVAHASTVDRYVKALKDSPAGLFVVGGRSRLSEVKTAEMNETAFDARTIYNSLRRGEVVQILDAWYGSTPDVPNGVAYETYLSMASAIPLHEFQKAMQAALKQRRLRAGRLLMGNDDLLPLRSILLQLDPTPTQAEGLMQWLKSKEN